jgi:hypothetical protein
VTAIGKEETETRVIPVLTLRRVLCSSTWRWYTIPYWNMKNRRLKMISQNLLVFVRICVFHMTHKHVHAHIRKFSS